LLEIIGNEQKIKKNKPNRFIFLDLKNVPIKIIIKAIDSGLMIRGKILCK
jgi:hypothetical protein